MMNWFAEGIDSRLNFLIETVYFLGITIVFSSWRKRVCLFTYMLATFDCQFGSSVSTRCKFPVVNILVLHWLLGIKACYKAEEGLYKMLRHVLIDLV